MSNIKIYGQLENATTDNKLADASQIYDSSLQKFQEDINSQIVFKSEKGKANGVATLDGSGKIPTEQVPGAFDDVIEYENLQAFPQPGEKGKIYVALDTNVSYRWGGTTYIKVGSPLELGETSTTAYAGDKGKATTDKVNSHVINTANPHSVTKEQVGLDRVNNTTDLEKPISTATQNALDTKANKSDLNDKVSSTTIANIIPLTSKQYIQLTNKDSSTLYLIVDSVIALEDGALIIQE